MLAMAEQTRPIGGPGAQVPGNIHPKKFILPPRSKPVEQGTVETVGGILGILVLVGIVLLAVKWLARRRSHRQLRADLEQLAHAEARLAHRLEVMRRRQVQQRRPREPTPR